MTQTSRDLVQRVLPHVRIRHWALSIDFAHRVSLAFDHERALAVWRIAQREIDRRYRRLARRAGVVAPRGGSLAVIHRASSDLKLNLHFHGLFLDGAYDAAGRFHSIPAPTAAEVEAILTRILARVDRLFERREAAELDEEDTALAQTYAASTRGDRHAPEDDDPHDFGVQLPTRRKARIRQWDLDAETAVGAHDRARLEHLCRYLLRPPLALDRLHVLDDGRVCLELKRPWSDRTTHVTMTPDAFIGRLASLVPRPRANTTLYFGVLSAHAKNRDAIVPKPRAERPTRPDSSWASLMRHAFGLDVRKCPRCPGTVRFIAVLHDRKEVRRLLEHLALWSEPLPLPPARGPPEEHQTFDFP